MNEIATPWGPSVAVLRADVPEAPTGWFTASELATAAAFRLARRRDEWLLSRAAAKQVAVRLGLCAAPGNAAVVERRLFVDDSPTGWHVSISHSLPYAGALLSRQPAGLDVQVVRPFEAQAAHLFLSDGEIAAMTRCAIPDRLLHFWCAKEAAWKRFSSRWPTMKALPLVLRCEKADSLEFDLAETRRRADVVLAISRDADPVPCG